VRASLAPGPPRVSPATPSRRAGKNSMTPGGNENFQGKLFVREVTSRGGRMSTTPAAELAATRTRWPLWSIRAVGPGKGTGFTARRHGASGLDDLWAPSLTALEDQLREYRRVPRRSG
jgi:hypothetical protein